MSARMRPGIIGAAETVSCSSIDSDSRNAADRVKSFAECRPRNDRPGTIATVEGRDERTAQISIDRPSVGLALIPGPYS